MTKFYFKHIINSYFISNYCLINTKDILKLTKIKTQILFKNFMKVNYITSFLVFSILTQTKPIFLKGLKNYKENKVDLKGLDFINSKFKYDFLFELIFSYILENKDCFMRLKKSPKTIYSLIFNKYFESIYFDKIYELNSTIRNTQQINFKIFFIYNLNTNKIYKNFFFDLMLHSSILPKTLQ